MYEDDEGQVAYFSHVRVMEMSSGPNAENRFLGAWAKPARDYSHIAICHPQAHCPYGVCGWDAPLPIKLGGC